MKTLFSSKAIKIIGGLVLVAMLAGLLALALPSGSVKAASSDQAQTPQANIDKLEKAYQRELTVLKNQGDRITKIEGFVTKAQDRINKLKANGKDVTVLEDALKDFQSHLATAKQEHLTAADILSAHQGFDANGKVTDAALAKDTVKSAAEHEKAVRQEARPAVRDLVKAIRQFIRDNRKK